jgi:hypothetical protein
MIAARPFNKATNANQNIGDTAYGFSPEPVIGPAIAGPVGEDDAQRVSARCQFPNSNFKQPRLLVLAPPRELGF